MGSRARAAGCRVPALRSKSSPIYGLPRLVTLLGRKDSADFLKYLCPSVNRVNAFSQAVATSQPGRRQNAWTSCPSVGVDRQGLLLLLRPYAVFRYGCGGLTITPVRALLILTGDTPILGVRPSPPAPCWC